MTQEQKAQAYDEVREKIALRFGSNVAEEVFSEFEMSEDERIRKWLYGYFRSLFATWIHPDITCEEILAWLEKQGEQKSAWSEDYTERMGQIINYLKCQAKEEPTRRRTLLGWVALLKSIFRKGLPEIQIPCTEAARKGIHHIMDVLEWAADKGRISDSDCEDYMILLSAYLPQPKQQWSEENERNLQGVIDEIEANKNQAPDYDLATYNRFLSWLKSLKQRYTWKPTDGQMKALDSVIDEYDGYPEFDSLVSLKNDLKKL